MPRKQQPDSDPPSRSKQKKRQTKDDSDEDESLDSKGNIRNLIDYDYEEEESDEPKKATRPKRKAAVKARQRIRRASHSSTESSEFVPVVRSGKRSNKFVEPEESEEDEEESEEEEPVPKRKNKGKKVVESEEEEPVRRRKGRKVVESESEEEAEEEPVRRRKGKKVVESESEEEEEPVRRRKGKKVVESESEEEEEEDESEEYEEESGDESASARIGLMISSFGGPDPNKPRKYKMKDQPSIVKKFVKLIQKEAENEEQGLQNIDNDITYFKQLTEPKQNIIIEKMERKFSADETQVPLKFKILEKVVPAQVEKVALSKYNSLMNMDTSTTEYYKCFHWIEGYSNMPLGIYKDLPVKIEDGPDACSAFVTKVRENMDAAIYGQDEAKLQILQFVSNWIANPKGAGNVLSIHGPMGVGKTTLVKEGVAKALGRPFHFISLGGATDASFLDGHSYTYEGSTWGRIVDILIKANCMNPIIYFDELDKISDTPKGEEIMNLLIHITDSSQNDRFQDKYFTGIDLDLSRCLFIFSHNNHERVNPILRDRMYNIRVEGFNTKEKLVIAETHLLPAALKDVGLHEKISISKEIIQQIIENNTGEEKGVRELKRCIQTITSKLNLLRFYNNPKQVPFAIPNFALPFTLKAAHVELFLKKKEGLDASVAHLYT
jgi:ATP-dependent Lon protease